MKATAGKECDQQMLPRGTYKQPTTAWQIQYIQNSCATTRRACTKDKSYIQDCIKTTDDDLKFSLMVKMNNSMHNLHQITI